MKSLPAHRAAHGGEVPFDSRRHLRCFRVRAAPVWWSRCYGMTARWQHLSQCGPLLTSGADGAPVHVVRVPLLWRHLLRWYPVWSRCWQFACTGGHGFVSWYRCCTTHVQRGVPHHHPYCFLCRFIRACCGSVLW